MQSWVQHCCLGLNPLMAGGSPKPGHLGCQQAEAECPLWEAQTSGPGSVGETRYHHETHHGQKEGNATCPTAAPRGSQCPVASALWAGTTPVAQQGEQAAPQFSLCSRTWSALTLVESHWSSPVPTGQGQCINTSLIQAPSPLAGIAQAR